MRHALADWVPIIEQDGRCLQYACSRCGVRIHAAVVICSELDEQALREAMPDRLIMAFAHLPAEFREFGDGRSYAAIVGLPACTATAREIEA